MARVVCRRAGLERVPLRVDLEALEIHDRVVRALHRIRDHSLRRRQRLRELSRELFLALLRLPYLDLVRTGVSQTARDMRARLSAATLTILELRVDPEGGGRRGHLLARRALRDLLEQARLVQHRRVLLSGRVLGRLERHGAARVEGFALRVPVPVVERRDTDSLMDTLLLGHCRRQVRVSFLPFAWLAFRGARALHRAAPADHLCVHGYSMALYHRLTALPVDDG